jgi:hypothetical protein
MQFRFSDGYGNVVSRLGKCHGDKKVLAGKTAIALIRLVKAPQENNPCQT